MCACRKNTAYWEIFTSLNFREFHISTQIYDNLLRKILGGVALLIKYTLKVWLP